MKVKQNLAYYDGVKTKIYNFPPLVEYQSLKQRNLLFSLYFILLVTLK